jgi:hypothetical protein
LKIVAFCLARDTSLIESSLYNIHKPLISQTSKSASGSNQDYSLSNIHPFAGLAAYNAPMCFLYDDLSTLYTTCRAAYSRIWCRMNVISGDEGTIFPLCKLFEVMLLESNPELFLHLSRIGLQPLTVAFSWMHQGFVFALEMDQLLLLWDRLLGFQDTCLFAVLAAAIFCSKSDCLLQVRPNIATSFFLLNSC